MVAQVKGEKPQVSEKQLVEDFAETASLHGFKVTQHSVTENHEREETRLQVTFVRTQSGQGILELKKGGKDDAAGEGLPE